MVSKAERPHPQCIVCGVTITSIRALFCMQWNLPWVCGACEDEYREEADKDYSMWPDHWYGHQWRDPEGNWHDGTEER